MRPLINTRHPLPAGIVSKVGHFLSKRKQKETREDEFRCFRQKTFCSSFKSSPFRDLAPGAFRRNRSAPVARKPRSKVNCSAIERENQRHNASKIRRIVSVLSSNDTNETFLFRARKKTQTSSFSSSSSTRLGLEQQQKNAAASASTPAGDPPARTFPCPFSDRLSSSSGAPDPHLPGSRGAVRHQDGGEE